jgi:hypothetical protein
MNVIQGFWIGASLPPIQRLSIRSFLEHGHQYHLYAYEEIADVPQGTTLCDASSILPRDTVFCYQDGFGKGSYSAFSNLFRYKLIFEKGGWWVDTDVVCLERFDFSDDFVFATELEDDGTVLLATCVFKSPAGSAYLDQCLGVCYSKNKADLRWSDIGPYLFDETVKTFGLASFQVPVHVFNPIHYFEFADMLKPTFDASRLANSNAVHLWNQMWKGHDIDPAKEAHPDSLYAALQRRYSEFPDAVR